MPSRRDEVAFGEGQEPRVLRRWLRTKQGHSRAAGWRVIKSKAFQDWDFLVLDGAGLPVCYVEIKVRRSLFSKYGDSICPLRKHDLARKLHLKHGIGFLMVTEHPDALVVVDLASHPSKVEPLGRHDRANQEPPMHAFWLRDQVEVVA